MAKWIVEQDWLIGSAVTGTWYYAVEADTLDDAIAKAETMEPHRTVSYDANDVGYDDSHEATEEEWGALAPHPVDGR
jgi:hypothetical protein